MKLTCPCCGAVASAEAWQNDAEARRALQQALRLPPEIQSEILAYLGLFRPGQSALAWSRAVKIMAELTQLTCSGWVQVQGKPARPCPSKIWAIAMRQMIDSRERLQRPMKNHNYLRQIAWQLADQADANRELQQEQDERSGWARAERQQERLEEQAPPLTEHERQTLKRLGLDTALKKLADATRRDSHATDQSADR